MIHLLYRLHPDSTAFNSIYLLAANRLAMFSFIIIYLVCIQSYAAQDQMSLADTINSSKLAELSGSYRDHGIDIDFDGKYDFLVFDIGVNVKFPGEYSLMGSLCDPYNNTLAWTTDHGNFSSGNKTLLLLFDGETIRNKRINSSYFLTNVQLLYGSSPVILEICDFIPKAYFSQFYNYSDFKDYDLKSEYKNRSEVIISGSGYGELLIAFSYKKSLKVVSGRYIHSINNIYIPLIIFQDGNISYKKEHNQSFHGRHISEMLNNFTVSANGVESLNLDLKKLLDGNEDYVSTEKGRNTSMWVTTQVLSNKDKIATIRSDLMIPGLYHAKFFGDAARDITRVDLIINLTKKIVVNGKFNLSINAETLPEGDYTSNAKCINGTIQLDYISVREHVLK